MHWYPHISPYLTSLINNLIYQFVRGTLPNWNYWRSGLYVPCSALLIHSPRARGHPNPKIITFKIQMYSPPTMIHQHSYICCRHFLIFSSNSVEFLSSTSPWPNKRFSPSLYLLLWRICQVQSNDSSCHSWKYFRPRLALSFLIRQDWARDYA